MDEGRTDQLVFYVYDLLSRMVKHGSAAVDRVKGACSVSTQHNTNVSRSARKRTITSASLAELWTTRLPIERSVEGYTGRPPLFPPRFGTSLFDNFRLLVVN